MKRRTLLCDTNVVLRFLVQDHPRHSAALIDPFREAEAGTIRLILPEAVFIESVQVREWVYETRRKEIAVTLRHVLQIAGVDCPTKDRLVVALDLYATHRVDFVDCLIAAQAQAGDYAVASFDRDFRRLA